MNIGLLVPVGHLVVCSMLSLLQKRPVAVALVLGLLTAAAAAQSVVISEFMYHPLDGTNPVDGDLYEFVELYNPTPAAIDLDEMEFTSGIGYLFTATTILPPGGYLVLRKDAAAFAIRYPLVTNVAPGVYSGKLSNGGEKVTLKDRTATTIFSVDYDDENGWPTAADGYGSSLVLVDETGDPDSPASWNRSDDLHGTPGEPGSSSLGDVVINELMSHTDAPYDDAIELHNRTTNAIDISGWYLSDDLLEREKYEITNTTVAAGGYVVFHESQFNDVGNPLNTPFALSELGDDVFLTASDGAGTLTRFVDEVSFGASERNVSLGRYPNATGEIVTLSEISLTNENGGPLVGPIVISEIMYHPANNSPDEEYIELLNISSSTVHLYDDTYPSNTWVVTNAVRFTFPTGVTMAPNERLLIAGASNLTAFAVLYSVDPSTQLFGPWDGKLNNAGESVDLYRPGSPETNMVPMILVDRVDYATSAPWPSAADGDGPPLERLLPSAYGNSAANWFAGTPGGSPGYAPLGGFVNTTFVPTVPAAGVTFTASVSVVADTLPTQVVMQVSVDGVLTTLEMVDDGVPPDETADDHVYSVAVSAQPDGTWFHYRFVGTVPPESIFTLPSMESSFLPSPTLTIRMSGSSPEHGLFTTVQPSNAWHSYETVGDATDTETLYIYLDDEGEALIDDVSIVDTASQTERVQNGDFSQPLAGTWGAYGTQSGSYREEDGNGSNHVLHLLATGAGGSWGTSVNTTLDPAVTVNESCTLRFRTRTVSDPRTNWLWLAIGNIQPDVVINEIMYHPNEPEEGLYEYVELYNPGASAVDLSGWELDGARLTFSGGTWIGPDDHVVCAAVTNSIQAKYSITNIVSAWSGSLRNGGELLRLITPFGRVADGVDYGDNHPWPPVADGYGPSLERIDSTASATNSDNWLASAATSGWQHRSWTGEINEANNGVSFFLDYDGKCWIDDVSIVLPGETTSLLPNGDFEAGDSDWTFLGNHAQSRVEPGMGIGDSAALALAGNMTRWVTPNGPTAMVIEYGDAQTNCTKSSAISTTNGQTYVVSWWARRSGVSSNLFQVINGITNSLHFTQHGTPGRPNSTPTDAIPMAITEVTQSYNVCPPGISNTVRATLPTTEGVTNVTLHYRAFAETAYEFTDGLYTDIPMRDDGVSPDIGAGDGIYAATTPAYPTNGIFVRYHMSAALTNGWYARYPRRDSPSCDLAYWVDTIPAQQSHIPNWHVLSDGGPIFYPFVRRACVVAPNGQRFVDVPVRHRGNPMTDPAAYDEDIIRSGLALRVYRDHPLDTWFADNQKGINFRHRKNDSDYWYNRVINEYLAYLLQGRMGLPTPRERHVCLWVDGVSTITLSLEDTEVPFLDAYDIGPDDYLSRVGWRGRVTIGGNPDYDNLWSVRDALDEVTGPAKQGIVATNINMEVSRFTQALTSLCGSFDQQMEWNMFQYRTVIDGRWSIFPWDADKTFFGDFTELHPYYQSALHPGDSYGGTHLPSDALYNPETGPDAIYTLPFRHRHQMTLWRFCDTLFTTNCLYPILDAMQTNLVPAYLDIDPIGTYKANLEQQVTGVKDFIAARRDFYRNGTWSDKDAAIWAATNVYDPSTVVINELMVDPPYGGEYVELYNTGHQTIDLSWWELRAESETYHIPHGTMLAPTSYLVVADSQVLLTNAYEELSDADTMRQRFAASPLWDGPVVWTSATEYATRVIQVPAITLPNQGGSIALCDLRGNVVDQLAYTNAAPWPTNSGSSLELASPSLDNATGTHWQACFTVGTPGTRNSAHTDVDGDGMADDWEQQIITASGGAITSIYDVAGTDDFDGDGLSEWREWQLGTSPTTDDATDTFLSITHTNQSALVSFDTVAPSGDAYEKYSARLYTLERTENLLQPTMWQPVPGLTNQPGWGQTILYTNLPDSTNRSFRYKAGLVPLRR